MLEDWAKTGVVSQVMLAKYARQKVMSLEVKKPRVFEAYGSYDAPKNIVPIMNSLLDGVPEGFYIGLSEIQITDSSTLSEARRRAKTSERCRVGQARALYSPASKRGSARIEIFLDKVLNDLPLVLRRLNFFKELVLAEVLFHELGHHRQFHGEISLRKNRQEAFAEECSSRLLRRLFNRKYKFLKPFVAIANWGLDVRDKYSKSPIKTER